jgi:hypothetical protein
MSTHEWVTDQPNIMSEESLTKIRGALDRGYIVVEHMHFYGGRSFDKMFIEDFEDFMDYIRAKAKPGDQFVIYAIEEMFDKKLYSLKAKFPDDQGRVPIGGSY